MHQLGMVVHEKIVTYDETVPFATVPIPDTLAESTPAKAGRPS